MNEYVISNEEWKRAYDHYREMKSEELHLYSSTSYEVGVKMEWMLLKNSDISLRDNNNSIDYYLGMPSLEYYVMIFETAASVPDSRFMPAVNSAGYRSTLYGTERQNDLRYVLYRMLRIQALRIISEKQLVYAKLEEMAHSFEYLYMYKRRCSMIEQTDITEMVWTGSGGLARTMEIDETPKRSVNPDLLEFYSMALSTSDPFTRYISFYHVIEYHFDAIYKKKVVKELRDKMTAPSFSYKSDKDIYELAKYAKKRMQIDDANGKGNELESLQYVLNEYVDINDLKDGIRALNTSLVQYYEDKAVSFAGSKVKIGWSDVNGVYATLSKRIYETRNSLVHTKSEMADKRYRPQKDKEALKKEIPLIQVIAELIIQATGEVL